MATRRRAQPQFDHSDPTEEQPEPQEDPAEEPPQVSPPKSAPAPVAHILDRLGAVPSGAETFGVYRVLPNRQTQRCAMPDPSGVDRNEWPIAILTESAEPVEVLRVFGVGSFRVIYFGIKADGKRGAMGQSKVITVREAPATAAPPVANPAHDVARLIAEAEARAELRAEKMMAREREQSRELAAQKDQFFKALMEVQQQGFKQLMEMRTPPARADAVPPAIIAKLAVLEDRQKHARPLHDEDEEDEDDEDALGGLAPVLRFFESPAGQALGAVIAAKFAPATPSIAQAPAPSAPPPSSATEEEDDADDETEG